MKFFTSFIFLLTVLGEPLKPLDIGLFHSLDRLGSPQVSPSLTRVLFTQSTYSQDSDKSTTFINLLDLQTNQTRPVTPIKLGQSYHTPLWISEDTFGYIHKNIVYSQPLNSNSTTALFKPPVDISSVKCHNGLLTFVASVYPNMTLEETHQRSLKNKTSSAQAYDNLWVRHWDEWMTLRKPTLFALTSGPVDLLQNLPSVEDPLVRWSVDDYTIDPKGQKAAFVVRQPDPLMVTQTNTDIYLVTTKGKSLQLLTGNVDGAASQPAFSQDGTKLAWLQMETPGYEADISRIYIHDIKTNKTNTEVVRDWDLSPISLTWSQDSLLVTAGEKGHTVVYSIDMGGQRKKLTERGTASQLRVLNSSLLLVHSDQHKPSNLCFLSDGLHQITHLNRDKLADVYLGESEEFWFTGALGDKVHGWLIKPPHFDPAKRYPLAYLVHGGPQQFNTHAFSHAQWNPQMYAARGFVTAQVNFHGSPSYGQNFTDSIRLNWGSHPYDDLMAGLDYLLQTYSYIDPSRLTALGASYGGYMMNWFNANTRRFKALVNHDGIFSTTQFYYSTEELWFPEHDFNGTAFNSRSNYEKFNPERLASQFSTPTLFVQGEKDYRVTADHSLSGFTLLRRRGIPSRLLYFPDENHWTLHQGNSIRWFQEVLEWINRFI